jgi:hypothetical protein
MHLPVEASTQDLAAQRERAEGDPPRFRDGAKFCLVVFLAVRILLSAVAVVGVHDRSPDRNVVGASGPGSDEPATAGWHNAIDGTVRWDAYWYISIARDGYDFSGRAAAFFPAYPALIRAVDLTSPLSPVTSAIVVSNAAFLAALIVLYALTAREYSAEIARRSVLLLALFPTAFFCLAPYSESLFLLSTVLTFWWARGDRWVLAALAASAAIATRSTGIILVPCLLLEAASARPHTVKPSTRIAASLAPLMTPLVYSLWWFERSNDLLAPFHAEEGWMRSFSFPLVTLGRGLALGIRGIGTTRGLYFTGDIILTLCVIVPLALVWRRIAWPFLAYGVLSVLMPLSYAIPARPLVSVPRYFVVVFPAFWAMALLLDRPFPRRAVLFLSVAGFVIASLSFMNWGFIL